jgi:hypothetical protein
MLPSATGFARTFKEFDPIAICALEEDRFDKESRPIPILSEEEVMLPRELSPIHIFLFPVFILNPEKKPKPTFDTPEVRLPKHNLPTPTLSAPEMATGSEPRIKLDIPKSCVIVFPEAEKITVELSVTTLIIFATGAAVPVFPLKKRGTSGGTFPL